MTFVVLLIASATSVRMISRCILSLAASWVPFCITFVLFGDWLFSARLHFINLLSKRESKQRYPSFPSLFRFCFAWGLLKIPWLILITFRSMLVAFGTQLRPFGSFLVPSNSNGRFQALIPHLISLAWRNVRSDPPPPCGKARRAGHAKPSPCHIWPKHRFLSSIFIGFKYGGPGPSPNLGGF